jgi:hypothetical protein
MREKAMSFYSDDWELLLALSEEGARQFLYDQMGVIMPSRESTLANHPRPVCSIEEKIVEFQCQKIRV